ncbi:hypothetical protein CCR75_009678 [Bremia lactucae]|uniref:Secreted protein n=1 Tax=Bremia lactucae TaxID=4779 RepID=A0A976P033_BRELC|nr:hypothetical protein CCR75_009678 [Bremia lactucae]
MKNVFAPIAIALAAVVPTINATTYACEAGLLNYNFFDVNSQATAPNTVCSSVTENSETAIHWTSSFNVVDPNAIHQAPSALVKTKFAPVAIDTIHEAYAKFSFETPDPKDNCTAAIMRINTKRSKDGSASFVHVVFLATYNVAQAVSPSMKWFTTVFVSGNHFDVYMEKVDDLTTFTYIPSQNVMNFVGNVLDFPNCLPKDSTTFPLDLHSIEAGFEMYAGRSYFNGNLEAKIIKLA